MSRYCNEISKFTIYDNYKLMDIEMSNFNLDINEQLTILYIYYTFLMKLIMTIINSSGGRKYPNLGRKVLI